MKKIVISKNETGIRFNKFLKKVFPLMPNALLYKMLRKKYFEINNKRAEANDILNEGDEVSIFLSDETYIKFSSDKIKNEPKHNIITMPDIKERIVYEDENVIIFNKPKNMLSQSDEKNQVSVNSILNSYINDEKSGMYMPSIVNRLDRNTSGLIIFCKTYIAAREISSMIKDGNIEKYYNALVNGNVICDECELTNLYYKDEQNNKAYIYDIDDENKDSKFCIVKLKYKVIKRNADTTLLRVNLITGKSHQIRAQLAHIGHPIVCDKKYMDNSLYKKNVEKFNTNMQELECTCIKFGIFNNDQLSYLNNMKFQI